MIGFFRELQHGRRIPTGNILANLLRPVLALASQDAIAQLRRGRRPTFDHWIPSIVESAAPMIAVYVREGQRQEARRLLAAVERRRKSKSIAGAVLKTLSGPWSGGATGFSSMSFGFDVYNPLVTEYIRTSTFNFVQATLQTAANDATKSYMQLRTELTAGLYSGDTTQEINRRVVGIFQDPVRASRVAQTEAARAVSGGGYMLAQETNLVTTVRWLASSDACPLCLKLNGQERKLGEPFMVLPKAKPPYNIIMHSPAHPHCFCTETYIVDPSAAIDSSAVDRLRVFAYDPAAVPVRFPRGERLAASLWERR